MSIKKLFSILLILLSFPLSAGITRGEKVEIGKIIKINDKDQTLIVRNDKKKKVKVKISDLIKRDESLKPGQYVNFRRVGSQK